MGEAFWLQIVITVGSVAALGGGILARLSILEKKVDKHNCFMERVASLEQWARDHDEIKKGA